MYILCLPRIGLYVSFLPLAYLQELQKQRETRTPCEHFSLLFRHFISAIIWVYCVYSTMSNKKIVKLKSQNKQTPPLTFQHDLTRTSKRTPCNTFHHYLMRTSKRTLCKLVLVYQHPLYIRIGYQNTFIRPVGV